MGRVTAMKRSSSLSSERLLPANLFIHTSQCLGTDLYCKMGYVSAAIDKR